MKNTPTKKSKFIKGLSKTPPMGVPLKVGDKVRWTNENGVTWENTVIGFDTESWYNKKYGKFVHIDTDSYWFPHHHDDFELIERKK